jgi:hypothetical protein
MRTLGGPASVRVDSVSRFCPDDAEVVPPGAVPTLGGPAIP